MSRHSTAHGSVVLGRSFDVPCISVYAAFADPVEHRRLAACAGVAMIADELDFRVGGRDVIRFGPHAHLRFRVERVYQDIVPARRIVSTDVVYEQDIRLSIALTTIELDQIGQKTHVKLTAQTLALDDEEANDDAGVRYQALIDGLGRYLAGPTLVRLRSPKPG